MSKLPANKSARCDVLSELRRAFERRTTEKSAMESAEFRQSASRTKFRATVAEKFGRRESTRDYSFGFDDCRTFLLRTFGGDSGGDSRLDGNGRD